MTDGSHPTASAASRSTHGPSEQEGKRALTGLLHMRVATGAEGETGTRGPAVGAKGQELGRAGLEVGPELGFGSIRVCHFFIRFLLCFVLCSFLSLQSQSKFQLSI